MDLRAPLDRHETPVLRAVAAAVLAGLAVLLPATLTGSAPAGAADGPPVVRAAAAGDRGPDARDEPPPQWGPSVDVAEYVPHGDAPGAVVRVLGSRTVAVWDRPTGRRTTVLRMSHERPDGRWSRPRTLASSPAAYLQSYDLELGPHGTALVVWAYGEDAVRVMETHREHGAWSAPRRLARNGGAPDGVIDGQGGMTVAWQGYGRRGTILVTSSRAPGGSWTSPRTLGEYGGDPTVAAGANGDVALAWPVDGGAEVFVKRAGQSWSTGRTMTSGFEPSLVDLAVGPDGRVLAMWSLDEDGYQLRKRHLAWARTDAAGTWSEVGYLDTRDEPMWGTRLSLSMNNHGEAFAIWQASGSHVTGYRTAYFDFDRGWTSPLSFAGSRYCCQMAAWLSDRGTAVVIYGPARGSRSASWAYRTPGQTWQRAELAPATVPYAIDGHGDRLVLLHFKPNLRSRTLTLPTPPSRSR